MNSSILVALFLLHAAPAFSATIMIPAPERNREPAKVVLPDNPEERDSWPLVMALHGFGNSSETITKYFELEKEARLKGFVLAAPNGRMNLLKRRFWNATDGCCDFEQTKSDDVAYLTGLIREISGRIRINSARVYVIGHSNGGFMAHRLACDTQGLITAFASFAGATFKNAFKCPGLDHLSMLQIHALDDGTISYKGDRSLPGLAPYPGAEETVNRYVVRNGCSHPPAKGSMDITATIPGDDAVSTSWSCQGNTEVAFWKIQAHRGPGHRPHNPELGPGFTGKVLDFLLSKQR
jgi:polyhydroxybutyrate depolymerase